MYKVLLIGSTGKLGSEVLQELVREGDFEIGVLVRNSSARDIAISGGVQVFDGDILLRDSLSAPIKWADVVINCSGYVSYKRSDRKRLYQTNVEGLSNIIAICSQFNRKLIHTSTTAVYGCTCRPVLLREEDAPAVSYKTAYAHSKIAAEKVVLAAQVPKIILRPSSLISRKKSTLKSFYGFYRKGFVAGFKGGASFALINDAAKAYVPALRRLIAEKNNGWTAVYNLGGNNITCKDAFASFGSRGGRRRKFKLGTKALSVLSLINDFVVYPLFNYSLITRENLQNGNHYNFIDSRKSINELDYRITPFEVSLKEIM